MPKTSAHSRRGCSPRVIRTRKIAATTATRAINKCEADETGSRSGIKPVSGRRARYPPHRRPGALQSMQTTSREPVTGPARPAYNRWFESPDHTEFADKWPPLAPTVERSRALERLLVAPAVVTAPGRYGPLAKEHASLAKLVKPYLDYEQIGESIRQAEALLAAETDAEMRAYAEEEV